MAQTIGVSASAPSAAAGVGVTTGSVTTTNGSILVLMAMVAGGNGQWAATPVQDSKTNTWVEVDSEIVFAGGTQKCRLFVCEGGTRGSSHTFTVNGAGTGFFAGLMGEVIGSPASPTQLTAGGADTSSPFETSTVAPSNACALVGICNTNAPSGTDTHTWAGSFAAGDKIVAITNADTSITCSMAIAIKDSGGTYSASVTSSQGGLVAAVRILSIDGGASASGNPAFYYAQL